jgi:hypothetical protein
MSAEILRVPITEEWLKSIGFRWHQFDRQPDRHWLLWLGGAIGDGAAFTSYEDLGIEVAPSLRGSRDGSHSVEWWFCWLRSDVAHRYSRFLHVRRLRYQDELIRLIEAIIGGVFKPENAMYGSLHSERHANYIREQDARLDRQMLRDNPKWREIEKDDSRGQALPEHYEEAEKHWK